MSIAENSPLSSSGIHPMEGADLLMGQVRDIDVARQQALQGSGEVEEDTANRRWFMYPIDPPELLETTGNNYFRETTPREVPVGETPIEQSHVIAVYNVLDYRLHIAAAQRHEKTSEYAGISERFDGRDRLARMLRAFGAVGDKAELIASELIANNFQNVGEYCDRWFVISTRGEVADRIIELEYFCLQAISKKTFKRFEDAFDPTKQAERNKRMEEGKLSDDGSAGESGRGTALMVSMAEEASIEWISHQPRGWFARRIGRVIRNQRGARLHFTINGSDVEDNPVKVSQDELIDRYMSLAGFDLDAEDPGSEE